VSTFGSNTSAIGLATSPTLSAASWTDQGMVIRSISSNNYNCIDPNAFQDTDRSLWLAFGSWWTGIKLVQLDTLTGKPAGSSPTIISLAQRAAPDSIEASFIIKRGSYYYLFVSFDNCCRGVNSTYKIYVGRASAVTGPYSDQSAVAMLSGGGTLIWAGDTRWRGPGGQSLFVDNDTVFLVFHSYDANDVGRSKLLIRPLYWTGDGWPTLTPTSAISGKNGLTQVSPDILNVTYRITSDRFVLPAGFKDREVACAIYDLKGKLLFRLRIENGIINLRTNIGTVQGVYIAQLSTNK
jgi:arabinan endo-1,5-alpha-L-arabinosidase